MNRHNSTIIFTNSRRLAERVCAELNTLADEEIARAHHGSVARRRRLEIEDGLKSGRLRAVVATSSLELGIDMGAVDLVVQIESPPGVASGLQRVGRSGHQVGGDVPGHLQGLGSGQLRRRDRLSSDRRQQQKTTQNQRRRRHHSAQPTRGEIRSRSPAGRWLRWCMNRN